MTKKTGKITPVELRAALEKRLGITYEEMLADTQARLYENFKQEKFVSQYLTFTESMSKRLLQEPEVVIEAVKVDMTPDQIHKRVRDILIKKNEEIKARTGVGTPTATETATETPKE